MFLPRSLSLPCSTSSHSNARHLPPPIPTVREKQKPVEDPAILCALAFSDYELWSNPTLRDPNRDGFVPLRTVLHTSSVFLAANSASFTEATIIKSLRAHASNTFDIRMIVVDKTRSRRHNNTPSGGYEVRRKDWAAATQRFPTFTPEYWDARTIYIENIPPSFRSMVGIFKLLHSLLPNDQPPSSPRNYRSIQSIYFPPHYQDPPDARPKCKGFALLTLSEPSAASHLLTHFPYNPERAYKDGATATAGEAPHEELEVRKAGFRTLSKERWEALQTEYVEYCDALIRRLATSAPPDPTPESIAPAGKATRARSIAGHDQASTSQPPSEPQLRTMIHATQSRSLPRDGYGYPPGCVIFVRHVPPDTNKTALRARFSALLADDDDDNAAALDYVDYTKGLDTCYLRLTTQEYALSLLKRFEQRAGEEIALELLDGRREEMYWECVPDKVRALAVQRSRAHQTRQGDGDDLRAEDQDASGETGERKRRRRRR